MMEKEIRGNEKHAVILSSTLCFLFALLAFPTAMCLTVTSSAAAMHGKAALSSSKYIQKNVF